jgi:hypothetical protein
LLGRLLLLLLLRLMHLCKLRWAETLMCQTRTSAAASLMQVVLVATV